ncbi:MAG: hypothetical protein R3E67_06165 [Pseudomonadales bacterium]
MRENIEPWFQEQWLTQDLATANAALAAGLQPIVGFSVYTWNAARVYQT